MRRLLTAVLSVLAIVAVVAPSADAQAPAAAPTTKVTISGFIDTVSAYTRNVGIVDLNYATSDDTEWYNRNRLRPDITAELGSTKFVLGLEIDYAWGQTGASDVTAPNRSGASAGADLNTDIGAAGNSIIEVKWGYVEFGMPGVPWATRVRLGAQPWATTYKQSVLASGDFAGAHFTATLAPPLKFNLSLGQVEESATGSRDGFRNGDDFALITSIEITPFKGLEVRPLYSLFRADGTTSGAARQARGGVATTAAIFPGRATENRHTIGVDARWTAGPFTFDPTVFFQFGKREIVDGAIGGGRLRDQDIRAMLIDLRGGFRTGPLLLEVAGIYTPGNSANEDIRRADTDINYFQAISTDTGYYSGWAEHWALGIDYFTILNSGAAGLNPGVAIGYDKYGLIRVGARASYAVTPAFTVRTGVTANWTDEKVDTDGTKASATGITPGDFRGNDRYLGTELNLGFQWRFAPGLAFDMVGAYTFNGDAMETLTATNVNTGQVRNSQDLKDTQSVIARLRYSF